MKTYEKQLLKHLEAAGWELREILPADNDWMACKYWKIVSRCEHYGFSLFLVFVGWYGDGIGPGPDDSAETIEVAAAIEDGDYDALGEISVRDRG